MPQNVVAFPKTPVIPGDVAFVVELSQAQAFALAELCKRIGWSDARSLSVDDGECRSMINATHRVRTALAAAGVWVR